MTNRIHAFTVVLERDTREDDVEPIIGAIAQIRGVLEVVPIVRDVNTFVARSRAREELIEELYKRRTRWASQNI